MRSIIAVLVVSAATAVSAQGSPAACSPLHLIYARATTEPPSGVENANAEQFEAAANRGWSKGYGAAGYSLYTNVTKLIPAATGWPVHYPASWTGCASENKGVQDILSQLSTQSKACPDQKFVMGGHSQGGVVTVRALAQVPADILPKLIAVTMFGSPNCPANVKDRCKSFCNAGDGICTGEGTGGMGSTGRCGAVAVPPAQSNPKGALPSKDGLKAVKAVDMSAWVNEALAEEQCAEPEVPEKGHKAVGPEGAHLLYNKDGYYTKAAACYILKKFKAAGGSV